MRVARRPTPPDSGTFEGRLTGTDRWGGMVPGVTDRDGTAEQTRGPVASRAAAQRGPAKDFGRPCTILVQDTVDSLLVDEVGDPSLAPGESTARALRLTGVGLVLLVALARPLVWAAGVALGAPRRSRDPIDSEPLLRTLVAAGLHVAVLAHRGHLSKARGANPPAVRLITA